VLKLNEVNPPLTRFTFGNKGLWLPQPAGDFSLREARVFAGLAKTLEKKLGTA
jgi:hypothetical protein